MSDDRDLELRPLNEQTASSARTLSGQASSDGSDAARSVQDLEAVYDIPVQVSAVLGRATMEVSQLLKLGRGAVVELDRKVGEAIDIYVNNKLVARRGCRGGGPARRDDDRNRQRRTRMMIGRMGRIPMLGRTGAEPIGAASRHAEKGTLVGLLAGVGMLAAAIALGGSAKSFVDLPSLLIVFGGTLAVIVICFSSEEVQTMLCVVGGTLSSASPDPTAAAVRALEFAEQARKHGLLRLELLLDQHVDSPFLRKAMCDGAAIAELEEVLRNDIQATLHRLRRSAAVLRRAADYAPAMGLIGTLIGLVQMLGHLDNPQHIGPGMAVALLTTFYGAVLANMFLSPLAVKLERNAHDEELVCTVYLMAAVSISRQENPRRLELLVNSVLPPAMRVRYFD
jgi:chemotaxis protein MotA